VQQDKCDQDGRQTVSKESEERINQVKADFEKEVARLLSDPEAETHYKVELSGNHLRPIKELNPSTEREGKLGFLYEHHYEDWLEVRLGDCGSNRWGQTLIWTAKQEEWKQLSEEKQLEYRERELRRQKPEMVELVVSVPRRYREDGKLLWLVVEEEMGEKHYQQCERETGWGESTTLWTDCPNKIRDWQVDVALSWKKMPREQKMTYLRQAFEKLSPFDLNEVWLRERGASRWSIWEDRSTSEVRKWVEAEIYCWEQMNAALHGAWAARLRAGFDRRSGREDVGLGDIAREMWKRKSTEERNEMVAEYRDWEALESKTREKIIKRKFKNYPPPKAA